MWILLVKTTFPNVILWDESGLTIFSALTIFLTDPGFLWFRSCRIQPLIQCDYCPLLFHADCLDPPLTNVPTGNWMCPNHVERNMVSNFNTSCRIASVEKLLISSAGLTKLSAIETNWSVRQIFVTHWPKWNQTRVSQENA